MLRPDDDARDGVAAFAFLGSFHYVLDKQTVLHLCRAHRGAHVVLAYDFGCGHAASTSAATYEWVAPLSFRAFAEAAYIADFDALFFDGPEGEPLTWFEAQLRSERRDDDTFAYAYLTARGTLPVPATKATMRAGYSITSIIRVPGSNIRASTDAVIAASLAAGNTPCWFELDPDGVAEIFETGWNRQACLWARGLDVIVSRIRAAHWPVTNETALFRDQHVRLPNGEPNLVVPLRRAAPPEPGERPFAFDAAAALAALAPPAAGHDETTFLRALRERVDRRLAIIDTQPATDPSKENAFNEFGKTHVLPFLDTNRFDTFVDKLKFKDFCREIGLKTTPLIRVLSSPNELEAVWSTLPEKFVVKSNKGAGRNAIVQSKQSTNAKAVLQQLENWDAPYWNKNECHYEHTVPRLFIETFIDPLPEDIKVVVVDNVPTVVWSDQDRFEAHTRTVYAVERGTANLTRLNDCFWHCPTGQLSRKNEIDRCVEKGLMKDVLRFATEISRRIDLRMVRVDFYIIDGAVTGGEVTLASGAFNEKISLSCAESATQVA